VSTALDPRGARRVDELRIKETQNSLAFGAETFRGQGSPIWSTLAAQAAEDREIVEIAACGKDPLQMFTIAAAGYVASKYPDEPLSRYLPVDASPPAAPEGAYAPFRAFVLGHREEILDVITMRSVQSTSVERAASVVPLLDYVADLAGEPLNLIEIGSSAGFLTLFDRYLYDYGPHGRVGDPDAAVVVPGKLVGPRARAPKRMPKIADRVGLDLHPIQLDSADERRWLMSQIYPEWIDARARMITAMGVVEKAKLPTIEGDATLAMPAQLQRMQGPLCVLHSACLYYFSDEARALLDSQLREASRERVIHRIGIEPPHDYGKWARVAAEGGQSMDGRQVQFTATHTVYEEGEARSQVVAICERYGMWMEWLV